MQVLVQFIDTIWTDDFLIVDATLRQYVELVSISVLDEVIHDVVFAFDGPVIRLLVLRGLASLRADQILLLFQKFLTT